MAPEIVKPSFQQALTNIFGGQPAQQARTSRHKALPTARHVSPRPFLHPEAHTLAIVHALPGTVCTEQGALHALLARTSPTQALRLARSVREDRYLRPAVTSARSVARVDPIDIGLQSSLQQPHTHRPIFSSSSSSAISRCPVCAATRERELARATGLAPGPNIRQWVGLGTTAGV